MNTVYTVQWRYCDNSGCGVSVVCPDKESAQLVADLLKGEGRARIAVGFGMAALTRDGSLVWEEHSDESWDDLMTGAQAEELAAADPDHDWQITLQGPLSGRTYQRHAPGQWALIEQNPGFA
jgi:hypothetical protein